MTTNQEKRGGLLALVAVTLSAVMLAAGCGGGGDKSTTEAPESTATDVPERTATRQPAAVGKIAFTACQVDVDDENADFVCAIYSMNDDGTELIRVTEPTAFPPDSDVFYRPVWSHDGRMITFEEDDIFVVNADGSDRTSLQTSGGFGPAWSPGTRIAFSQTVNEEAGGVDIFTINPDGSDLRNLTSSLTSDPGDDEFSAVWSPDGSGVAFVSATVGDGGFVYDIYAVNADGSDAVRVTSNHPADPTDLSFVSWSPDGARLLYTAATVQITVNPDGSSDTSAGADSEIYVVDVAGGTPIALTDNELEEGLPSWSPDGQEILFLQRAGDDGPADIYVINTDGSGSTNLTETKDSDEYVAEYSPDGERIAFIRDGEIWVMNRDGSGLRDLAPRYAPEMDLGEADESDIMIVADLAWAPAD